MNSLTNSNKSRGNSAIEITRFVLLIFLLFTHVGMLSFNVQRFMDVRLIQAFSGICVISFAMITGMFVFKKDSQLKKNISRIFFVILFSCIIGIPCIYLIVGSEPDWNHILTGSVHSWYLYAILVIYFIGPLFYKWMDKQEVRTIIAIGLTMFALFWAGVFSNVNGIGGSINNGFTFLILLPASFLGYAIKRMSTQKEKQSKYLIMYLSIFIVGITSKVIYEVLGDHDIANQNARLISLFRDHSSPFTFMMSFGVIGAMSQIKWYSSIVNKMVSNMYFIYEYHWIVYMCLAAIFKEQLANDAHLWIYIGFAITFAVMIPISFILTIIQRKWWIPFSYKIIDSVWTKIKNSLKFQPVGDDS